MVEKYLCRAQATSSLIGNPDFLQRPLDVILKLANDCLLDLTKMCEADSGMNMEHFFEISKFEYLDFLSIFGKAPNLVNEVIERELQVYAQILAGIAETTN